MDTNIIISIFAFLASIYAIYSTKVDVKKQLRLSKLEEVLEIIAFMQAYYNSLFRLFHMMREINETLKKSEEMTPEIEHTIKLRNGFIEAVTSEIIMNKTSRLVTLANAYLPNSNNLKLKTYTLSTLYFNMYSYIKGKDGFYIGRLELSIIPRPKEMEKFIQKIESLIIDEMNLGYKNVTGKERREYFEKRFRNDLENAQ